MNTYQGNVAGTGLPGTTTPGGNSSGRWIRWAGPGIDLEEGLATAEYAVATIGAVGFAGLLIAVLKSDAVRTALSGIIERALSAF